MAIFAFFSSLIHAKQARWATVDNLCVSYILWGCGYVMSSPYWWHCIIFLTWTHLVEEIPQLFLSLYDLLPVLYLLVFNMLLLQPARADTSLPSAHICRHVLCVSVCGVHHTHCMTTSRACPRETGLLLRKLKSSWWLRKEVASSNLLNSCSTISSFSFGTWIHTQ